MSAPFVTGLRTRRGTLMVGAESADAITIRVEMAEVWDVIAVEVSPAESVVALKEAALEVLLPDAPRHQDFVMKLQGWEILDEKASLAAAGVTNGSILLMTYRRRRAVR